MSSSKPSLTEAAALLAKNEDPQVFAAATETLFSIVKNAATGEEKYRKLQRSGKTFSSKVACAKGGVRFLKACGFVEEGADALVLAEPSAELLAEAKAMLKSLVKQHADHMAAVRAEERRVADEAAALKLQELKAVSKKNTAQRDAAAEAERQRLLAGIKHDKEMLETWKQEYDAMKKK